MPFDISQTKTRTLIFGAAFIAATVISGNFAAAGAAGLAIQAVGGIAGNIGANDLGEWIKCFGQNQSILDDQYLTKAIGKAISLVILDIANQKDKLKQLLDEDLIGRGYDYSVNELHEKIKNLHGKTEKIWLKISQSSPVNISDSELTEILKSRVQNFHDIDDWKEILKEILKIAHINLEEYVINYIAQKLYHEFPHKFKNVLKNNADNDGEAFTHMLLNLFTEIFKELEKGRKEIIAKLDDIKESIDNQDNTKSILEELKQLLKEIKQQHSETVNKLSFEQRVAELLCLLNYSNQEQEFKNALDRYKEGVFLVRAEEENIQRWLVWRLARFIRRFKQAEKKSIRIRSHPMRNNFNDFWDVFKQYPEEKINRELVIQKLSDFCQTKSVIIVIYGLSYLDTEKVKKFYQFWLDLVDKVSSTPRSPRSRLVLILAEKNSATVTNKLLPFTFVESSSTNHNQCFISLKPLKKIFKNDVKNWLKKDEVDDEINQTDDEIQSIICNDIPVWEEEPLEVLREICYTVFQIEGGIGTIQNYWKLT